MEMLAHEGRADRNQGAAHAVARGLGWFSIGLGLAEFLMPQTMARAVGLEGKERLVRAFGVREIASGVGLLMSRDPEPWVWGRVAGDALDFGALSAGLRGDNPHRMGTAVAMLAVAQVAAVDVACAKALGRHREQAENEWRYIDYRDRRGFDKPVAEMRGAALSDFRMPDDYRTPTALRPWERELPAGGLYV
jgi:hypothetical protein